MLVTAIEALSVIDSRDSTMTQLIVELFLSSLPEALAMRYRRTLMDGWSLVALSPTDAVRAALAHNPPASVATTNSGLWISQSLDEPTGRFRPAQSADTKSVRGWWTASARVTPRLRTLGAPSMWGAGTASTLEAARTAAVAEAHERFAAGCRPVGEMRTAIAYELVGALDPRCFIDYTDEQRERNPELIRYEPLGERLWVEACSLNGERRWILADLVFYPFGTAHNRRHTSANSSGMAAGRSVTDAATSAWFELVERDAFMRSWLGRLPGDHRAPVRGNRTWSPSGS